MVGNENWQQFARESIDQQFSQLDTSTYQITSPDTIDYNCVAWAAEDSERWWWPDAQNLYYWPPGIAREATLQTFMQVYEQLGYERCETPELEPGLQKVAIYTDKNNIPVHVARQLPNGQWTSKLGSYEDIEHGTLQGLTGEHPAYGSIACYMVKSTNDL